VIADIVLAPPLVAPSEKVVVEREAEPVQRRMWA
jgi:hypothetical protein